MSREQLEVKLVGSELDEGDVVFSDLTAFAAALQKCLAVVQLRVHAGTPVVYRVVDIGHGSCYFRLQPSAEQSAGVGDEVLGLFKDTVRALEEGSEIDPRIKVDDLKEFGRLRKSFNTRIRSVSFGAGTITDRYTSNIERLLAKKTYAHGDAKGMLEKLDVHDKSVFTLYPPVGQPIRCQFPADMLPLVVAALCRNVTVAGRLTYRVGNPSPILIDVKKMTVHPPDDQLPTLAGLRELAAVGGDGG